MVQTEMLLKKVEALIAQRGRSLKIEGFARNLKGSVEIFCEGTKDSIEKFLENICKSIGI